MVKPRNLNDSTIATALSVEVSVEYVQGHCIFMQTCNVTCHVCSVVCELGELNRGFLKREIICIQRRAVKIGRIRGECQCLW